jgi:hypothetical protein
MMGLILKPALASRAAHGYGPTREAAMVHEELAAEVMATGG